MRNAIIFISLGLCAAAFVFVAGAQSGESSSVTPQTPVPAVGSPGGPLRELNSEEMAQWIRGRQIFDRDFHFRDGLGLPDFNGDSCRACHEDPAIGGAGGLELNVSRFGQVDGMGNFSDVAGGQAVSKFRRPDVVGMGPREEIPAGANVFEQRQTPTLFGVGLINTISDAEILANADPSDADADGVFGIARMIDVNGQMEVGHYGWKAQIPQLRDFIHDAMAFELGITTPDEGRGFNPHIDNDIVADPELSTAELDDLFFFISNLAAPQRKGSTEAEVVQGEMIFDQIGCAKCHVPSLMGSQGPVPLYSNLLLHNVQPAGFQGMEEPGAPSGFYRTPPLWGILDTAPFWHDGRAETLTEAILLHAGEAQSATDAFDLLSPADRDALLSFLADL